MPARNLYSKLVRMCAHLVLPLPKAPENRKAGFLRLFLNNQKNA